MKPRPFLTVLAPFFLLAIALPAALVLHPIPALAQDADSNAETTAASRLAQANQLVNDATDLWQASRFRAAIEKFLQALQIYRAPAVRAAFPQESRQGEGQTLMGLGATAQKVGRYEDALSYFIQALAIRRELGDRIGEGQTLNNIGLVYDTLDRYEEALAYYTITLTIRREIGDRPGEVATLSGIGAVYRNLGRYEEALSYLDEALSIAQEEGDRAGEAATLTGTGTVYDTLGRYEEALASYTDALAIRHEMGDRAGEGAILNNIGVVYDNLGHYEKALASYTEALAIRREIGDRAGEGTTLHNIGGVYYHLDRYEEALSSYTRALAMRQEVGDRAGEAITLYNLGYVLDAIGEPELAIVFLKQSVNRWEAIRNDIRGLPVEQQQSFTDRISDSYRRLADLLLQSNRILEAQRVLDLLRVQELDEYLQGVRGTDQTRRGVDLLDPEVTFTHKTIAIGRELAGLRAIPASQLTPAQLQRLTELDAAQRALIADFRGFIASPEIQSLVAQLSTDTREQDVLTELGEFINLQNNLRTIDQNAVLIYPLILEDRLELVLVTPFSEPARYPVAVTQLELNTAIVAFRQALTDPNRDPRPFAHQLYTWLIAPMASDLEAMGAETILYAPDGALRYVPLAALYDGHHWLVEHYRINHITAASLQDLTLRPDPQPQVLAAAFSEGFYEVQAGDRTFPFDGLPFAGVEVANLSARFPGTTVLVNAAFSRAATEPIMDSYTIVHLATHAAFVQGAPSHSFILFGNGDRLTLEEIRENWEGRFNQVNLIVLSACETGVGDADLGNGEEILGFGYLMQEAGAEAAIASLWSVSDGGTEVLMDAFYTALSQGYSKAEALQRAQISLITHQETVSAGDRGGTADVEITSTRNGHPLSPQINLSHPYYWAPFILIGNGL